MTIGLLYGENAICYGTLGFFLRQIEEALKKRGVQTVPIYGAGDSLVGQHFDAFVGMNLSLPAMKIDEDRFLFDYWECPFFDIFVDPPYYHSPSLREHMKHLYAIFLDDGHVAYCRKYFPPCENVERGYLTGPMGTPVPYRERKYDILFTGSLYDYESIRVEYRRELGSEPLQALFDYLIAEGIHSPNRKTTDVLDEWSRRNGWQLSDADYNIVMSNIGLKAEYYLRGYWRAQVLKTLLKAGLKVHVLGSGWERLAVEENNRENLIMLGSLDMEQTGEVTANAKILLNVMPWFKEGVHDRIFTAMQNGCVCVTDPSSVLSTYFTDGEDIVFYELERLRELPERLKGILADDEMGMKIAGAGTRAGGRYNWDSFVFDHILKWLL